MEEIIAVLQKLVMENPLCKQVIAVVIRLLSPSNEWAEKVLSALPDVKEITDQQIGEMVDNLFNWDRPMGMGA
jgi:hypothetical protein